MYNFKICKLATLAIILLLSVFCCTSVNADDTSLGRTPEGVFPLQENDVIMEAEEIVVDLEKNSVECIFVFHNTGKSKNVYMGFPGKLNHEEDGLTHEANLQLSNFKTFVKGKELKVTREKTSNLTMSNSIGISDTLNYSEYFTFTVPFKADEKLTVRNTYDFNPTYDSIGYVSSGYVLKTGAMWKESIGSAKVTFKLGSIQPYQISRLRPSGFKFVENTLVWERSDFEPSYDLIIEYDTYRYSAKDLSNLTDNQEKLKQEIKQKIDSYNKVKELINKGGIDELLALYNKAVDEKDSILALLIRSYLPSEKIPDEKASLGNITIEKEYGDYYAKCDVIGAETAFVRFSVSHIDNGNKIIDEQVDDITSCYLGRLTPGIEYNITYTVTDWLDRTEQRTIKYRVPEQIVVPTENQPINEATKEATLETKPANETPNVLANGSADNPANETGNSGGTKLIFAVLSGIIILGLIVVSVMLLRKKLHG